MTDSMGQIAAGIGFALETFEAISRANGRGILCIERTVQF
jgi:hypothetical protein